MLECSRNLSASAYVRFHNVGANSAWVSKGTHFFRGLPTFEQATTIDLKVFLKLFLTESWVDNQEKSPYLTINTSYVRSIKFFKLWFKVLHFKKKLWSCKSKKFSQIIIVRAEIFFLKVLFYLFLPWDTYRQKQIQSNWPLHAEASSRRNLFWKSLLIFKGKNNIF